MRNQVQLIQATARENAIDQHAGEMRDDITLTDLARARAEVAADYPAILAEERRTAREIAYRAIKAETEDYENITRAQMMARARNVIDTEEHDIILQAAKRMNIELAEFSEDRYPAPKWGRVVLKS